MKSISLKGYMLLDSLSTLILLSIYCPILFIICINFKTNILHIDKLSKNLSITTNHINTKQKSLLANTTLTQTSQFDIYSTQINHIPIIWIHSK